MPTPMDSWLKRLKPASWRGLPFLEDTTDYSQGDATVLRQFPFQDKPTIFSMGGEAGEIKLEMTLAGHDYLDQRDRMEAALRGEGVLVLSSRGAMRCWVHGKINTKESLLADGGVARISVTFIQAEARRYPTNEAAQAEQTHAAAADVAAQIPSDFAANWGFSGTGGYVREQAASSLSTTLATVTTQFTPAFATLEPDAYTQWAVDARLLDVQQASLISQPLALATGYLRLFDVGQDLPNAQAQRLFYASATLWRNDSAPLVAQTASPYATPSRAQARANAWALHDMVQRAAVVLGARCLVQLDLQSFDRGLQLRREFNNQLSTVIHASTTRLAARGMAYPAIGVNPMYQALCALQGSVLQTLQAASQTLGRVSSYTPTQWESCVLVSYKLYGTMAYAGEIYRNNPHVQHPLLCPPGVALRVVEHDEMVQFGVLA